MVNPFLSLVKGLTTVGPLGVIGFVCLSVTSIVFSAPNSPTELWAHSLEAFKADNPREACSDLKNWVATQEPKHIQSAETFYNLALCSWRLKENSQSVVYALKSLQLRNSPLKRKFFLD